MEPVTLNEKDMAAIEVAAKRVWLKLADDIYSKDFLDRILNALENYRKRESHPSEA
jgi:hypothetical protein